MPRLNLRSLFRLRNGERGVFHSLVKLLLSLGALSLSVLGSICDWGKMPQFLDEVPDQHQWSV